VAKTYTIQFRKGARDYIDDTLWWKAAQEEDQKQNTGGVRSTAVNTGETPSDDIGSYLGITDTVIPVSPSLSNAESAITASTITNNEIDTPISTDVPSSVPETSNMDELILRSTLVNQLSGKNYKFGNTAPLNVRVYELNKGEILACGEKKPCFFYSDGIDCDFVYNPSHPLLAQYPITPKMLLLQYLAEKLKARDHLPDVVAVFSTLVETAMPESKIDRQSLQDRASSAFELLREKLSKELKSRAKEVIDCVHEASGEVEETITNLIQSNPSLIPAFQDCTAAGFDAIDFVPPKTLYRLVEKFPENVFDGKAMITPYSSINLLDENATRRARDESKERALSFIKDALRVVSGYGQRVQKNELTRASLSVDFLLKELGA
jgi:hypothetical protein